MVILFGIHKFNVDAPEVDIVLQYFTFANPLFIYAISFLFDTDFKASIFIRIFYITFGGLAPISVKIMEVLNPKTMRVAHWFDSYFNFWPIYNFNHAYLSITQRHMISWLEGHEDGYYKPLDYEISGKQIERI